jgi:hypothetical protein
MTGGSARVPIVGSKLAIGMHGATYVIVTTPSPQLPVGARFLALGNAMPAASPGVYWLGRSQARPPTQEERLQLRNTGARSRRTKPVETPDELLKPEVAITAARVEQQREPADLISGP